VATDEQGRQVGQVRVKATPGATCGALGWAGQWPERRWAIDDCRHLSRRLERDLLAAGEQVVGVPPRLMAASRRGVRTPGKSDPIDALAVARAALREPELPVAHLDGWSARCGCWSIIESPEISFAIADAESDTAVGAIGLGLRDRRQAARRRAMRFPRYTGAAASRPAH
jgi:hypothetical protein